MLKLNRVPQPCLNFEGRKGICYYVSLEKARPPDFTHRSLGNWRWGGSSSQGGRRKLGKCLLVVLPLIYFWTWCPASATLRLPAVVSSAVSPAARCCRCPLVYKALFETWLAAPLTGNRLKTVRLRPPKRGGAQPAAHLHISSKSPHIYNIFFFKKIFCSQNSIANSQIFLYDYLGFSYHIVISDK